MKGPWHADDRGVVRIGSVCSGYGGLEMGICSALPSSELAWVADYEPPTKKNPRPRQGAARILAHRFPSVPNLGDITATRWADTPPVKIVCGGTPCQDMSVAGAAAGMRAGTRSGLWSSMAAAIAHHRPALVVWENVRGALSAPADSDVESCPVCVGDERDTHLRALGRVLGDLADLRYDAVWCCLPACDVGAPHRRERVFVLAWPAVADPGGQAVGLRSGLRPDGSTGIRRGRPDDHVAPDATDTHDDRRAPFVDGGPGSQQSWLALDRGAPADPSRDGRDEGRPESARQLGGSDAAERGSGAAADPDGITAGRHGRTIPGAQEQGRREPDLSDGPRDGGRATAADSDRCGREPVEPGLRQREPDPAGSGRTDWGEFGSAVRRWEHALGRSAPAPTEPGPKGGQRLSPRFVEWMMGLPEGWVTDVPGLTKNDQLHALGNGVVPQQAAAAIRQLLRFAPARIRAAIA